ncbi:MAG: beta-lactamase family protein, partial [Akkermansiaceae bacterium]|nr:beta-lactamase family protein [Akkermansiaceae bacterium]
MNKLHRLMLQVRTCRSLPPHRPPAQSGAPVVRNRGRFLAVTSLATAFTGMLGVAAAGPAVGGLAANSLKTKFDPVVEKHFNDRNLHNLVVLYARDGMLVYRKTLGHADAAKTIPVTQDHVFRHASISKLEAAALTLRLAEKGKINLNAKVKTYLPDIPDHHDYRIRDLLACRSGVVHYPAGVDFGAEYDTALDAAKEFWDQPLGGPIEAYLYTTAGGAILGACLESATGKSISKLIKDELATPNGLATLRAQDLDKSVPKRVDLMVPKDPDKPFGGNKKIAADRLEWKVLGGGIESSGIDLLKFGMRLADGKVISKASLAKMMTRPWADQSYALGCNQAIENGYNVMAKSGGQRGVSSYIWTVPDKRMVMVVLTNRKEGGGAPTLGKALRKIALNTSGASGQKPDLVVQNFKRTGQLRHKDGKWEIPVSFTVKNQGGAGVNNQFVNGILHGTKYRWSGFMPNMPKNAVKNASGVIRIPDPSKLMAGRKVTLTAWAD